MTTHRMRVPFVVTTLACCFFVARLAAQTPTLLSSAQFPTDILPQSPEAGAMAKYTLLPVTLYSGLPQINIPLYQIKTPNLSVPISLGYNYNGFKPAEVASYVGLGWNVQGTGVITRLVKSRVDHMDFHVLGNDYDNYVNMNLMASKQVILDSLGRALMDGEPDIYVFNAPGLSGKFIMMQGKAYMFPHQDILIQSLGEEIGFVITNEKGDRYTFRDAEESYHPHTSPYGEYIPTHNSAYFLSSIVSADLSDTIQYAYSHYTFQQPPNYSEKLVTTSVGGTVLSQTPAETPSNGDYINALVLLSIQTRNEIVYFNRDTASRKDIFFTQGTEYPLASVSILPYGTASSGIAEKFTLLHDYFNGKLNLTEVDESVNLDTGTVVTTSIVQRYKLLYNDATQGATSIPGWNNKGVDHWGYYNGATNASLFTASDVGYMTASTYGIRTPNFIDCKVNSLSRIIYPTGGYDTLIYDLNQTGHYNVLSTYTLTTLSKSIEYASGAEDLSFSAAPSNSITAFNEAGGPHEADEGGAIGADITDTLPLVNGARVFVGHFSLVAAQKVAVYYNNTPKGTLQNIHPVVTILTSGGTQQYASAALTPSLEYRTDSVYLPVGTYTYEVTCDSTVYDVDASITYKAYAVDNTLADGPGIRLRQVSSYDGVTTTPALTKQYSYNNFVGYYINDGVIASTVLQHGELCTDPGVANCASAATVLTLQAGFNEPTNDLANSQFYYQNVDEVTYGPSNNGKVSYTFNCFAPTDPDVFLQQSTTYGYQNLQYVPLSQTTNTYTPIIRTTFQTLTSAVTDQMGANGCVLCPEIPTPDVTQPIAQVVNAYGATHGQLTSGYKSLSSTINTTWDQNGANAVSTETDYYYDNPSYLFPTRTVTHDSKGQAFTTQMKYPLDYPVSSSSTPAALDSVFNVSVNTCTQDYNTCYDNLFDALVPYQPYSTHASSFASIANSYTCEATFKTESQNAFTLRNSNWTNYLSALASAQTTDTVGWHKALYWMQANNVLGPVIEKYVSVVKSDGNEYLLSAARENYSLITNASGVQAAKQTSVQATELPAPILKTTFLANTEANYKLEQTTVYDNGMRPISRAKTNDVAYNYLWGYGHQLPVAVVQGSSPATIAGFINQNVLDAPASTATLITELAKIRTGLAATKALATTCTYDPLIGMTSKTDPAGHVTYYDYDGMQRLVTIRDQDKNIVKKICYSYNGQPAACPNKLPQ